MLLKYNDEQVALERNNSAFTIIFEKVNELIDDKDIIFSHLVVDGVEVYENHEEYINNRLKEIMQIEIITHTTSEMIWETMGSIKEYLDRAIPALNELVDKSYDDFSKGVWDGIGQLSEGMQWIVQFITFTRTATDRPANWDGIEDSFQTCEGAFAELLQALENKDTVLISDILAYEIIPAYEELKDSIKQSLNDNNFIDING